MRDIVVEDNDLIAERVYTVAGDDGRRFAVRFGKPFCESPGFYRCNIQFTGEYGKESIFTMGVDGVHAIDSAFWMAGTILSFLNKTEFGGRLEWDASSPGKPIGLPVIPPDHALDGNFRDY